jgi:hypothetical protein
MKTYVPDKSMRSNPLSRTEGGSTIKVVYQHMDKNPFEVIYENIKYPQKYIDRIMKENEGNGKSILQIFINEEIAWEANSK